MKTFLFLTALLSVSHSHAQSPGHFTADGAYLWVSEDRSATMQDAPMVIVRSTNSPWKMEIAGISNCFFSSMGTKLFFQRHDTLFSLVPGSDHLNIKYADVSGFRLFGEGVHEWIACQLNSEEKELILENTTDGTRYQWAHIADWQAGQKGNTALLKSVFENTTSLLWADLSSGNVKKIWEGSTGGINNYTIDDDNKVIAFILHDGLSNQIWHFNQSMDHAEKMADDSSPGITDGLLIADEPFKFTSDGKKILFNLKAPLLVDSNSTGFADLWSYTDAREYSMQTADAAVQRRYAAVIDINNRHLIRLEQDNDVLAGDYVFFGCPYCQINDQYALVIHFAGNIFSYSNQESGTILEYYSMYEYSWNRMSESEVWLVSLRDGKRILLNNHIKARSADFPYYRFSAAGRFVVYYDQGEKKFFTYEIKTGIRRSISARVPVSMADENPEASASAYNQPCRILNWTDQDAAVMIWDHYGDIWQLDPMAVAGPINITNGISRKNYSYLNHGRFELINDENRPLKKDETLFFRLSIGAGQQGSGYLFDGYFKKEPGNEKLQTLVPAGGKYHYNLSEYDGKTGLFLVTRSNAKEPPIYYYTNDFKVFNLVTGEGPDERKGNAIKKELLTWRTFDGSYCQGVLFKPKNFDPRKKYPVIIYYYEKKLANMDFQPYPPDNEVDVFFLPGYIYFLPDIHYKLGHPGAAVYNCVVSGAEYISRLPYVNGKKMGITGTSYGGFETNYLLAHTQLFAAAFTSCGYTDYISEYGFWDRSVRASSPSVEIGQNRLGATPWERPDLYLENSPVMYADKITTPVLIAHNYDDPNVPFAQNVELYKALRRLGKPCWMLVGNGGHGGPRNTSLQFFDFYLKGAPCPKWMLGVSQTPAKLNLFNKGKPNFRYDLDSTGAVPRPGLNYPQEIRTPQQSELLKNQTRLNEQGLITKKKS